MRRRAYTTNNGVFFFKYNNGVFPFSYLFFWGTLLVKEEFEPRTKVAKQELHSRFKIQATLATKQRETIEEAETTDKKVKDSKQPD